MNGSRARRGCAAISVSAATNIACDCDRRPVDTIGCDALHNLRHSCVIERPFRRAPPQRTSDLDWQHRGCHAIVTAQQSQDFASSGLVEYRLIRALVSKYAHAPLGTVFAVIYDGLGERLTLDLHRPPAGCGRWSLPSGWPDQPFVGHRLKCGLWTVLIFDALDHGHRASAVSEHNFLAGAHGLDGLREALVGFAKSEPHVVMILHSNRSISAVTDK